MTMNSKSSENHFSAVFFVLATGGMNKRMTLIGGFELIIK